MDLELEGASVNATLQDGVLTATFEGRVSRATLGAAALLWRVMNPKATPRATVIRLDGAQWTDGESPDLEGSARTCGEPFVLVVPPESLTWFRRYTHAQAVLGRTCGAFIDAAQAQSWVLERAAALMS